MTIHDLILEKMQRREGKPSQDIFKLLLKEEAEEGPGNDGLLFAYMQEAQETLADLIQLRNEERLWKRIIQGETVKVKVASTGKMFTIRKTEDNTTGLPAYDIVGARGKVEQRGLILDKKQVREWCYGLVEDN